MPAGTTITLGLVRGKILAKDGKTEFVGMGPIVDGTFKFNTAPFGVQIGVTQLKDMDRQQIRHSLIEAAMARGWTGRAFNPFNAGAYVEFAAFPQIRTYIDGRTYVTGPDGLRTYLAALANYRAFTSENAQYRFDLVLVDLLDPSFPRLIDGLQADPAFALVWLDSRFAIFVPAARASEGDRFRVLRAGTDPRYLLEVPDNALPRAREEVGRVLASPEGEILGRLLRGQLALRENGTAGCAAARDDFQRLVQLRPDVPMFRLFLAEATRCAGDLPPFRR